MSNQPVIAFAPYPDALDYEPVKTSTCDVWLNFDHGDDHHHVTCDREHGHDGQHRSLIAYKLPIGYVTAPVWWALRDNEGDA